MNGLVLWFNPQARVGMIWCEDQGPLAFLSPEVKLPGNLDTLECGDRITFSVELRGDVRYIRDIYKVAAGSPGADPRDILLGYYRPAADEVRLSVVA